MKYLILLMLFASCSDKNQISGKTPIVGEEDLYYFRRDCAKLAKCMDATSYSVKYMPSQNSNPYACDISVGTVFDGKKVVEVGRYIYPSANLSFGKFEYNGLEEGIKVCEIIKRKGDNSVEAYREYRKIIEQQEKESEDLRIKESEDLRIVEPEPEVLAPVVVDE